MVQPINNATTTAAVNASQPAASRQTAPSKAAPAASNTKTDTVTISNAAQTAMQEATETQNQTVQEARAGDRQAQHLLAKETAAKQVGQPATPAAGK
ncbi:MAG TPA: hypothetical protein VNK23_07155 [Candidatus Dormibacteraeota bacterium]|nr:hypothetical protein [Candidatus Dormibacteraeota bacterium]